MVVKARKAKSVPRLEVLFGRCPVCSGSTNLILDRMVCESCDQEWTVTGRPIEYEVKWVCRANTYPTFPDRKHYSPPFS